ncbi:hypothetical protein [Paracoccus hibiscisoli]|uniref:Uncharacterized protein n=1 Tax=Paracoccus hibiscisoli TaxID=2023261 RepID=A0A4U0QUM0_9RHOB|nr:hypothetical protein [Paracoccus hibiscisoli]TJZ85843.1 hypothetical protein FA740_05430 [Paracoccus hibiscisoli]
MAVAIGTMARLKNGGAWSFFPGGPETAVEAFGPGVEIEIRTVGEVFDLETLPAVSAPTINQPDPIVVPFGTGFTDNMAHRVSGGVPPYTFSQVQAAPLPLGVTITAGGNLTGSNQFPVGGYGWSVRVTDSRVTDGEPDPQSATINYLLTVEALPQVTPHWVVTSDQRAIIDGVTAESGIISFTLTEPEAYAGTHTVNTALLAAGPVCLVPPRVVEATQNPGFLVMIPGLWVSLSETITIDPRFVRDNDVLPDTGLSFDIYPAYEFSVAVDGGKTIYPRETVTDANGARSAQPEAGYFVEPTPVVTPGNSFEPTDARIARTSGASVSSFTLTSVNLGAPDPNRVIEIDMGGRIGTTAGTAITAVTIGGVAATPLSPQSAKVEHPSSGDVFGAVWSAPVPEGTSGNVVISFSQPEAPVFAVQVWRRVGLVSDAPVFVTDNVSGNGTVSRTVSMLGGERVVFGIASRRGMGEGVELFTPSANLTQIADISPGTVSGAAAVQLFIGTDFAEAEGPQTYSATSASSGSSNIVTWTRKLRAAG